MIQRGGRRQPFSKFNKVASRPVQPQPMGIGQTPFQKVQQPLVSGGMSNPALNGMKHTMLGRGDRGGGREGDMAGRDVLQKRQQQMTGFVGTPGVSEGTLTTTPETSEKIAETYTPTPVHTTPETTTGGGWLDTAPEWGTEDYQQGMYNLAREQQSGQTAADVEYARTMLGGQGLRAGESGIASKALMNIRQQGSERLGQRSRELAMQGMGARYGQQQDLMKMIMDKYGMDIQAQQGRYNPYWNQEQQYAGSA